MDPSAFDRLVRSFVGVSTRRRLVAALSTVPLMGTITGLTINEAEAERPRQRLQRRKAQHRRKQRNRKRQNQNSNNRNGNGGNKKKNNRGGLGDTQSCAQNGQSC